jgi:hypothetical protein
MQCDLTADELQLIHTDYHTLVRMVLQLEARVKVLEAQRTLLTLDGAPVEWTLYKTAYKADSKTVEAFADGKPNCT